MGWGWKGCGLRSKGKWSWRVEIIRRRAGPGFEIPECGFVGCVGCDHALASCLESGGDGSGTRVIHEIIIQSNANAQTTRNPTFRRASSDAL